MRKALVLTHDDPGEMRRNFRLGAAPAMLPYQIEALEASDFQLAVRGRSQPGRIVTKLRDIAEHRTGLNLETPARGACIASKADVVIALLERQAEVPAMLKRHGVTPYARRPLVVWSCWLADDLSRLRPLERKAYAARFASADLVTHMSSHETDILLDAGFRADQVASITFGVSHRFYSPDHACPRDGSVLAVGQDRGRDFKTLFEAVRGTTLRVDLVCRPENIAHLEIPPNVVLHGTVSHTTYRSLLRRASVVAVPTDVRAYPTGQSVALEAASSGCAVIATETPAMADYIVSGKTGVLVPPFDVDAWRSELVSLDQDEKRRAQLGAEARRSVETTFNAERMWRQLALEMSRRGMC